EHDVLGRDLGLQLGRQHAPPVVVAQRDRDGPLGPRLADDVAVELGDDLGGREAGRLPDELERGAVGRHGVVRARRSGVEGVHQASPSSATGSSPSSCLVTPAAVTVRTVALPLVNTSISAAIARAARPISSALMSVCRSRAVAAACAYGPPDPTAATGSSGAITSPAPDRVRICWWSATISIASRFRRALSVRHSFTVSTAALVRLPR